MALQSRQKRRPEAMWTKRTEDNCRSCKGIQYAMPRCTQYISIPSQYFHIHPYPPSYFFFPSDILLRAPFTTSLIPPPQAGCLQGLLAFDISLIVAAQGRVAGWHVTNCAESGVVNLQWSTPAVTTGTKLFTSSTFAKMLHQPCPPELCVKHRYHWVPCHTVPGSSSCRRIWRDDWLMAKTSTNLRAGGVESTTQTLDVRPPAGAEGSNCLKWTICVCKCTSACELKHSVSARQPVGWKMHVPGPLTVLT